MRALSRGTLRELRRTLDLMDVAYARSEDVERLKEVLDRALTPKRSTVLAHKRVAKKKRSKAQETRDVRAEVMKRAMGVCEAGQLIAISRHSGTLGQCGGVLGLDHFRGGNGRRKAQESLAGCWMLCSRHHDMKTRNYTSSSAWLGIFAKHCLSYGYMDELAETQARLDSLSLQGRSP